MTSPYLGGSSSSGGSPYLGGGRTITRKKKKESFFGRITPDIVENLGRDIKETAFGLGPGLVEMTRALGEAGAAGVTKGRLGSTERLERLGRGLGKSYAYTYGPLFRGHPGEFWNRVEERPLGPILDAITLATLGYGGGVRAGLIRPSARELYLRPVRLKPPKEFGEPTWGGVTQAVPVTGGELVRRLKLGTDALLKKLPPDYRVLGEWSRYTSAVNRQLRKSQASGLLKVLPWYRVSKKLSTEEGIALTLRAQFPTEGLLRSYQDLLKKNLANEKHRLSELRKAGKPAIPRKDIPDQRYIDALTSEKMLKYFREPSPAMIEARKVAEAMDKLWVDHLVRAGVLSLSEAEWIRWEPSLVALGAKYRKLTPEEAVAAGLSKKLMDAKGYKILEAPPGMTIDDMIASIQQEIAAHGPGAMTKEEALSLMPRTAVAPENKSLLDQMGAAINAKGMRTAEEPMYFPHVSELKDIRIPRTGGGMVSPRAPVYARTGVIEAAGRMILMPEVWTAKFLENAKFLYYNEKHANLILAALPVDELPNSTWRFITRKNERIENLERTAATFDEYMDNVAKELGDDPFAAIGKQGTVDDLITANAEEAAIDVVTGKRLALPEKMARKIIGDYTRSANPVTRILRDTTTVWRALVLNLRVGWLVNNVLGNTFLYAIKNAGPEGIRAYVQAVGDAFGEAGVRRLWNDKMVRSHLTPADIIELFPEQYVGTFFGTQIPTYGRLAGSRAFVGKYSPTRFLRSVDVYYEQALRRAMINKLVRRSPEFRQVWEQMPVQTRTVREAMRKSLHNNPRLQRRISAEVNNGLGDFFNLTDFEQRVLRGAAPFYAWYRAITTIMLRMPVEAPLRTNILVRLGELGNQITAEDYGLYYLGGAYPLGGNKRLGLKSVNPFTTPIDVAQGLGAVTLGTGTKTDVQNFTGMMNPLWYEFLFSLAQAQQGQSPTGLPPVLGGPYEVFRSLPETRLFWPYPSKLYEGDPRMRELLAYLGIPIKTVRPQEARRREKRQ